jgi:nucleoside-diphosphate-sugar epimerase
MKKIDVHQELPKALVTGCAGNVGSEVTKLLLADGFQVFGLDNLSTGSLDRLAEHENFQFINGDIRDLSLFNLIGATDYVFHCAGMFDAKKVSEDPVMSHHINVVGSMNVLEYCRRTTAKLIYTKNMNEEKNLLASELAYFERTVDTYVTDYGVKAYGILELEIDPPSAMVVAKDVV